MRRTLLGIFAGLVIGIMITGGAGLVRGQTADGDSGWVPDMESIFNTALGNAFEAAGEKFTDPELKAYYDRLTADITNSLETPVAFDPGIDVSTPTPVPTVAPPTPTPTPTPVPLVAPTPTAIP